MEAIAVRVSVLIHPHDICDRKLLFRYIQKTKHSREDREKLEVWMGSGEGRSGHVSLSQSFLPDVVL